MLQPSEIERCFQCVPTTKGSAFYQSDNSDLKENICMINWSNVNSLSLIEHQNDCYLTKCHFRVSVRMHGNSLLIDLTINCHYFACLNSGCGIWKLFRNWNSCKFKSIFYRIKNYYYINHLSVSHEIALKQQWAGSALVLLYISNRCFTFRSDRWTNSRTWLEKTRIRTITSQMHLTKETWSVFRHSTRRGLWHYWFSSWNFAILTFCPLGIEIRGFLWVDINGAAAFRRVDLSNRKLKVRNQITKQSAPCTTSLWNWLVFL